MKYTLLSALCFISFAATAQTLDNTFGTMGKTVLSFQDQDTRLYGMALDNEDRIISCGLMYDGEYYSMVLTRQGPNGALDTSFGNQGVVLPGIVTDLAYNNTVAVQPDGKILLAGAHTSAPDVWDFAFVLMRFNTDGTPDNTFGTNGKVVTNFEGGANGATCIAVLPDSKILVAGFTNPFIVRDIGVVCYNADGTLDSGFSQDGMATFHVGPTIHSSTTPTKILLQQSGKIVITGSSEFTAEDGTDATMYDFSMIRISNDGTLDTTFGQNGVSMLDFGGNDRYFSTLLTPSDEIVIAGRGFYNDNQGCRVILAKFSAEGVNDTTFGTNGKTMTNIPGSTYDFAGSISQTADGKFMVAGGTRVAQTYDGLLLRYTSNGILDTTYNAGGFVTANFGGLTNVWLFSSFQSSGKLVLGGSVANVTPTSYTFGYGRYLTDNLGISEAEKSAWTLFPNPVANVLNLKHAQGLEAEQTLVYDGMGKLVLAFTGNRADISALAAGVYVAQASANGQSGRIRFIKQ